MIRKINLFIVTFIWILALLILIISLTDLYHNTILKEYRLIIGISFIILTKVLDSTYHSVIENDKRT